MKKVLSLFLAFVFAVGICASAPVTIKANAASVGDLTFELNEDGESYYVSGCSEFASGEIVVPTTYNSLPVTSIGVAAFSDCTSLTSITIPDSVTSIGWYAFENCTSLTSITIPDSVKSIEGNAFYNTGYYNDDSNWENNVLYIGKYLIKSNEEISGAYTIKSGTKTIAACAFKDCSSLTSVTIPDSVTSIGDYGFEECSSLTSVYITDIASWCNIEFADYYANPLYYAENLYLNGELVTELTIPESVTEIKDYAFEGCTSLTSITIPDSVTSIGGEAFCFCSSLTSITIPDSVTSIGDYAFWGCESITSITIPDSVTSIGEAAFYECTSLTSITIPDSVMSIGWYAFEECTSLTSITIPDSVKSIGGNAFYNTGYYNDDSNWENNVLYIGKHFIETNGEISGAYTIKSGTKTIADCAFYYCTSLTSITIPDSVTSIGENSFDSCSSLTSITIPYSVKSIGWYAFSGCTSLTSVYITDIASWCNIDFGYDANPLFNGADLYLNGELVTELTIPDSVTEIKDYAFKGCSSLTRITIPGSVTSIGEEAFRGCSSLTSVAIPDSVTSIGWYAFYDCTSLTNITIPDSVTSIGDEAFWGCTSLTSVTIPDSVKSIGWGAFDGCTSLTSVAIGDGLTSIGGYTFRNCTSLTRVTIPDSVTSISSYAFDGCTSLKSITIPAGVTSIGWYAFEDCTSLTSITIPSSVTSIGGNAFYNTGYYNNNSNWENKVLYIGKHLIKSKKEIPGAYTIKSGTKTIADCAFEECSSLKSITIPDSVTSIGNYALGYYWNSEKFEYYKIEGFTIYGVKGSEAEKYAKENGFTYAKPISLATPVAKTANTAKGIKVTWNKIANAEKYVVYQRTYNAKTKKWSGWKALKTTTGLSYVDTTTKLGTYYSYTVRAVKGSVKSSFKATKGLKYDVKPTVTVANASNGIKVSWSTVANATGYTVYSSTYNAKTKKWSGWKNRGTTKANAKSWVDKSAKAGTVYKYTVRARYGSVASSFVASASLVRLLNPTVKVAKASNGVKVTWNKIAGAKNYKIYRAQYVNGKWSGWSAIKTTNNKTFAYVDKTAKKGVYYKYTVRAVNGKSASAFTASKNVKR